MYQVERYPHYYRFDANLGRSVLAHLLSLQEKANAQELELNSSISRVLRRYRRGQGLECRSRLYLNFLSGYNFTTARLSYAFDCDDQACLSLHLYQKNSSNSSNRRERHSSP